MAKEVRKPPEVSYADLQALTAKVNHSAAELGSIGQAMQQVKTKDLVLLHEQMTDVMEQVWVGTGSCWKSVMPCASLAHCLFVSHPKHVYTHESIHVLYALSYLWTTTTLIDLPPLPPDCLTVEKSRADTRHGHPVPQPAEPVRAKLGGCEDRGAAGCG